MEVSYLEGLASYGGPESCLHIREGVGEALIGGRAGRVMSCASHAPGRKAWDVRRAGVVGHTEGHTVSAAGLGSLAMQAWTPRSHRPRACTQAPCSGTGRSRVLLWPATWRLPQRAS